MSRVEYVASFKRYGTPRSGASNRAEPARRPPGDQPCHPWFNGSLVPWLHRPRGRRWTTWRRSGTPRGKSGARTASTARKTRAAGLRDRHAAAHGQRLAARRHRIRLRPDRRDGPLPADARHARSSTRWAGTTTACPPSGACRTITACAATPPLPYDPAWRHRAAPARRQAPAADLAAATSSSCASELTGDDERRSRTLWRRRRPVGRLAADLRHHRRPLASASPSGPSCATSHAARRTRARPRPCGTWTSATAVAQAELEDREHAGRVPPARLPRSRTATPVEVETTRPELLPACVALVAHPDDERYQPLFGTTVRTPLFGVRVPVHGAPAGRPGQGHRHRDDLHVRRHHRRRVVAGARPAGPVDPAPRRPLPRGRARLADRAGAERWAELAGRTAKQARARHGRAAAASPATWSASRGRSCTRSSSTRRATGRWRSSPAASGTSATAPATRTAARVAARAGARAGVAPRRTCGSATSTGSRASTPTG